ncbi:MAG: hypothetical protein LCH85_22210 [Chloroflexi bacterium]|nr:hypothetical protein [Chloroflexota bacterium]
MMIDPVETLLRLCLADTTVHQLTRGQIANQHKFLLNDGAASTAWEHPSQALCLVPTNDAAATTAGLLTGRMNVYAFGATPQRCYAVWAALDELCRIDYRRVVETSLGKVLLYSTNLDVSPFAQFDTDLVIDYLIGSLRYQMHAYALEDV